MEAEAKSFTFLANEGRVVIPFFQRSYVWTKDNWDELLADLLNFEKSHFLGSLILKQSKARTGKSKEALVIDGQQRLTTLSILVKALYDSFDSETQANSITSLRNTLFFKKLQTDKKFLVKIEHSHVDATAFKKIVTAGVDLLDIQLDDKDKSNIIQCYFYFKSALQEIDVSARNDLFNALLDPENKILVVIDLDEDDNEQAIFDTINSAGVKLSGADIIKNSLFQQVINISSEEQAIDLYGRTWKKTFLEDIDTIKYWDQQRSTGRLMRDNMEILLHSVAVIKGFYEPDRHTLSELPSLYKIHLKTLRTLDELSQFAGEITDYANIYKSHISAFDSTTALSYANVVERTLHVLDVQQITTFHPFILYVLKNFRGQDEVIQRHLLNLQKFVIRRMLSKEETKSYNKLSVEFIQDPTSITARFAADENVSAGLRNISNKNAALLLFWIELYRRNSSPKFDTKHLNYNYTLEHIMPQKWEEYWAISAGRTKLDGTSISIDEAKSDRMEKVYWIGNMTLLTSSLNTALRNYEYRVKMSGEGRKKGIRSYADLSITKEDLVIPFDNGDTIWDEEKIKSRTIALEKEVFEIWGIH